MGRPPLGAELVTGITGGSELARRRLAVILETISGAKSIEEAGVALGVGRSRFHAMRSRFLSEATTLLEPRPPGPRPQEPTEAEGEVERLRGRVEELELQVKTARVREELATAMPHILKPVSADIRAKKTIRGDADPSVAPPPAAAFGAGPAGRSRAPASAATHQASRAGVASLGGASGVPEHARDRPRRRHGAADGVQCHARSCGHSCTRTAGRTNPRRSA